MKRKIFLFIFVVLVLSIFVNAMEQPTSVIGEDEVEKIQENVDKYMPLDSSGEVDIDKFKPFKTKAEERIDEINAWLETNAKWLKVVFGMVPSVTLHFFMNLWLIFVLITYLILNAESTIGLFFLAFNKDPSKKIDLGFIELTYVSIVGIIITVLLVFFKQTAQFAKFLIDFIIWIQDVLIPAGQITIIVATIILIALYIFAPGVLMTILKRIAKNKIEKASKNLSLHENHDREILHRIVSGATKGS